MNTLVAYIIENGVNSCLMVAVVLLLRLIFKKASKSTIYMLWIIVGVRLAVFIPIESNYALMPRIMQNIGAVSSDNEEASLFDGSYNDSRFQPVNDGANLTEIISYPVDKTESVKAVEFPGDAGIKVNSISRGSASVTEYVLFGVWLAGFLGMLTYGLVNYLRLRKRLATAVKDADNNDIFYTEHTKSAFVFGIIKARIYLSFCVEEKDKDFIIFHEREHIRRKDYLVKFIGYLLLSVYWFAPWIWLAFLMLSKDMELACDEGVISSMKPPQRAGYAEILYKYCSGRSDGVVGMIHFGEVNVKKRLRAIMNYKKMGKISIWLIGAIIVSLIILIPVRANYKSEANTVEKAKSTITFPLDKPEKEIADSLVIDFSSDDWSDYFYTWQRQADKKWYLADDESASGKSYLLVKDKEDMTYSELDPAMIYIGQPEMANYSFSFDLLLDRDDFVQFCPFSSDMETEWKYGDEIRTQYCWFTIGNGQYLCFETSFDQGSYRIDSKIPDLYRTAFKENDWNHIEMFLEGRKLHMSLNGYDLGVVFTFDKEPHGSATIRSFGGSRFRNIAIKF
ncbi:MAG: M56 family metallopeptidase [Lachnospiraceae bacterium]|nr:M56 family metallopeptidase [Lachnospiraceae bacterium]